MRAERKASYVTARTAEAAREAFDCTGEAGWGWNFVRMCACVCLRRGISPLTPAVCPGYCEEQGAVGGAGLEDDLGDLRLEEENEQPPLILETD